MECVRGGDAVTGPASVIRAIAGGREAAISIDRLMQGAHLHSERDEKRRIAENLPGEGILTAPRSERPPFRPRASGKSGAASTSLTR